MSDSFRAEKFWRLLADYERLTDDEGVALRAQDFDGARAAQIRKPPVLEALRLLGEELGLDAGVSPLSERIEALRAAELSHQTLVSGHLSRAAAERRSLHASRVRLKGLSVAYAGETPLHREAFFARG